MAEFCELDAEWIGSGVAPKVRRSMTLQRSPSDLRKLLWRVPLEQRTAFEVFLFYGNTPRSGNYASVIRD